MSVLHEFRLSADRIRTIGADLQRPECVLALDDGTLLTSDLRGLAAHLDQDGRLIEVRGKPGGKPNGLALREDGSLLVADIGRGRVIDLSPDGRETNILDSFAGAPLGACNFVLAGPGDDFWVTVSSRTRSVREAIDMRERDGMVLHWTGGQAELVLDGLDFANEMRLGPDGRTIVVAETLAGRVSQAELDENRGASGKTAFGPVPLYEGAYTDGIAFDCEGNLWLTELSRNAILVITPAGDLLRVFEDPEGRVLKSPTSLAFGGEDRRTIFVGSLRMNHLACFRSPLAGAPLAHWSRYV